MAVLSWQVQILLNLLLSSRDLFDSVSLGVDQSKWQGLLHFQRPVVLFVDLEPTVVPGVERVGKARLRRWVRATVFQFQVAANLVRVVLEEVIERLCLSGLLVH